MSSSCLVVVFWLSSSRLPGPCAIYKYHICCIDPDPFWPKMGSRRLEVVFFRPDGGCGCSRNSASSGGGWSLSPGSGQRSWALELARAQGHTCFGGRFRSHCRRKEEVIKDPGPVSIFRKDKRASEKSEPAPLRQDIYFTEKCVPLVG